MNIYNSRNVSVILQRAGVGESEHIQLHDGQSKYTGRDSIRITSLYVCAETSRLRQTLRLKCDLSDCIFHAKFSLNQRADICS